MKRLQITKNVTPRDLEGFLLLPDLCDRYLELPNKLSNSASLGLSIALSQFILSWARVAKQPTIKTFLESTNRVEHESFVARVHGLAAAYYSKEIYSGAQNEPSLEIRSALLASAKPRIEAMHQARHFQTSKRPTEIEYIFIEKAKREFHGAIYSKAPTPSELADKQSHGDLIRQPAELNRLMHDFCNNLHTKGLVTQLLSDSDTPLGSIVSEAFRNTADHAYIYPNGDKLNKNLRCLRVANIQTSRDYIQQHNVSSPSANKRAQTYFNNIATSFSPTSKKIFICSKLVYLTQVQASLAR